MPLPFGSRSRQPVAFGAVVALHVLLAYGLLHGLARKVVEVIRAPLQAEIVEEKRPPPPPPEELPPPPVLQPPPPSFVPPPEVRIRPPPKPPPVITTTPVPPPPAPVHIAPPPPPAPAPAPPAPAPPPPAPPAPPAPPPDLSRPARLNVSRCERPQYPVPALRSSAEGTTRIRFTVDANGRVTDAEVAQSSGRTREHRLLDRAALQALSQCSFVPGSDKRGNPVGGKTTVEYVWRLVD